MRLPYYKKPSFYTAITTVTIAAASVFIGYKSNFFEYKSRELKVEIAEYTAQKYSIQLEIVHADTLLTIKSKLTNSREQEAELLIANLEEKIKPILDSLQKRIREKQAAVLNGHANDQSELNRLGAEFAATLARLSQENELIRNLVDDKFRSMEISKTEELKAIIESLKWQGAEHFDRSREEITDHVITLLNLDDQEISNQSVDTTAVSAPH